MSDIMRPVPFEGLLTRIFGEYKASRSIFDIAENQFYRKADDRLIKVFGETCETPVGPAAGPHTQLAQNIVVSWLTGGRFIELKTVQIMDRLEIAKPCIDAEDECYNTEWSTEYTLPKAFDEYLKAWFALHLLEEVFDPRQDGEAKSFSFNMSVGYDLDGHQAAADAGVHRQHGRCAAASQVRRVRPHAREMGQRRRLHPGLGPREPQGAAAGSARPHRLEDRARCHAVDHARLPAARDRGDLPVHAGGEVAQHLRQAQPHAARLRPGARDPRHLRFRLPDGQEGVLRPRPAARSGQVDAAPPARAQPGQGAQFRRQADQHAGRGQCQGRAAGRRVLHVGPRPVPVVDQRRGRPVARIRRRVAGVVFGRGEPVQHQGHLRDRHPADHDVPPTC